MLGGHRIEDEIEAANVLLHLVRVPRDDHFVCKSGAHLRGHRSKRWRRQRRRSNETGTSKDFVAGTPRRAEMSRLESADDLDSRRMRHPDGSFPLMVSSRAWLPRPAARSADLAPPRAAW